MLGKELLEEKLDCDWSAVFDSKPDWNPAPYRVDLLFLISVLAMMFAGWPTVIIQFTKLRLDPGYQSLLKFIVIGIVKQSTASYAKLTETKYSIPSVRYLIFGIMENFLTIAEIEALTMACIDRYVLAKYKVNGWARNPGHMMLYNRLIVLFAVLYTCAPLIGIGQYGFDFTCMTYTYDMKLPSYWITRNLVLLVFFLKSVKPVCFMFAMIFWARKMENRLPNTDETQAQKNFTNMMAAVVVANILCWAPFFFIRGWVLLNQLLYEDLVMPSPEAVYWAHVSYGMAPTMTTVACVLVKNELRSWSFELYTPQLDNEEVEKMAPNRPKTE